jgi:hypothetical protein
MAMAGVNRAASTMALMVLRMDSILSVSGSGDAAMPRPRETYLNDRLRFKKALQIVLFPAQGGNNSALSHF